MPGNQLPGNPNPGNTMPGNYMPSGYTAPQYPQYPQSAAGYPPAYAPPPVTIPPPPPAPLEKPPSSHFLPVLVLALGAMLLFACGFAVWTLTSATSTAAEQLREQVSTQVVNIFPPAAAATSRPTDPVVVVPVEPSPWPTFTPEPASPTEPAAPTAGAAPTNDPTQSAVADKLLSEGCSAALDNLGGMSDQITSQPTVAFDAQWRADFNAAIANMKTNCGTLDAASPVPGQIGQAQQNLAQAQSEFDQAGKLLDEGVSELQPGKLLEAGEHVAQALKSLNLAIKQLRELGN
jgi:hypothetical protein